MFNKTIKILVLMSIIGTAPYNQHAGGPRDWYRSAKKQYSELSTGKKVALGVGTTAAVVAALYYALQRNDKQLQKHLVEKWHNLPTWDYIKDKVMGLAKRATYFENKINNEITNLQDRKKKIEYAIKEIDSIKSSRGIRDKIKDFFNNARSLEDQKLAGLNMARNRIDEKIEKCKQQLGLLNRHPNEFYKNYQKPSYKGSETSDKTTYPFGHVIYDTLKNDGPRSTKKVEDRTEYDALFEKP